MSWNGDRWSETVMHLWGSTQQSCWLCDSIRSLVESGSPDTIDAEAPSDHPEGNDFGSQNFLGQLPTVISELGSRIYISKSAILIFFSVSLDFFAWNFYHCETTFEIGSIAPQIWHLVVCRFRIYVIRIFYCPYCSLNSTNNGGSLFLDLDSLASASSGWRVTRSFRPNFSASTTW